MKITEDYRRIPKITEALFIQKLNPDLNGKYEQLNVLDFLV